MAGCSSTLRSPAARSGPAKKKKAACRCGTEVAASSPSCWAAGCLPVQPGTRAQPAPPASLALGVQGRSAKSEPVFIAAAFMCSQPPAGRILLPPTSSQKGFMTGFLFFILGKT